MSIFSFNIKGLGEKMVKNERFGGLAIYKPKNSTPVRNNRKINFEPKRVFSIAKGLFLNDSAGLAYLKHDRLRDCI